MINTWGRSATLERTTWSIARFAPRWTSALDKKKLLIVDDDAGMLNLLRILFKDDFDVWTARDGETALAEALRILPDAVVLDLEMPGMNGRSVYQQLRLNGLQTPVLILSAYGAQIAQIELGAQAFMNKPFEPMELLGAVSQLLD